MKRIYFIAILCIYVLNSCASNDTADSSAVDQAQIHQALSAEYSETGSEMKATAVFRFGGPSGTTLRLKQPSSIQFDEQKMKEGTMFFGGAIYRLSLPFTEGEHRFRFTDTTGKAYVNSIVATSFRVTDFPPEFRIQKDLELHWEGLPFRPAAGETLNVHIRDTSSKNSLKIVEVIPSGNTVIISAASLAGLKPGPVQMEFVRKTEVRTQQHGQLPGRISFIYRSRKFEALARP